VDELHKYKHELKAPGKIKSHPGRKTWRKKNTLMGDKKELPG
jgi:hypothetical protein